MNAIPLKPEAVEDLIQQTLITGPDGLPYSDLGNALRLQRHAGDKLRYVPRWNQWMHYSAGRWHIDYQSSAAGHALTVTADHMLRTGITSVAGNGEKMALLVKTHKSMQSAVGLKATLTLARTIPELVIHDHELLDANAWLLNVPNGTVNLRTGELQQHDSSDLLTMVTSSAWDPESPGEEFARFIEQTLPNPEVRSCVQEILGQALVGEQLDHLLPLSLGAGANGKSALTEIIAHVVGEYGTVFNRDLVIATKHQSHATILATLFRKRFAHSGEIEQDSSLNEAQVKELTGGDRIITRRMREDEWEFDPSHLLWLHANHRPAISGTDHGIWRRVLLIPYPNIIAKEDQDEEIAMRIATNEGPAVLAWMFAGLQRRLERGHLQVPEIIQAATDEYRSESDTVQQFLDDSELIVGNDLVGIAATNLADAHDEWARSTGLTESMTSHYKKVTQRLKERGCTSTRSMVDGQRQTRWKGVGYY